MPDKGSEALEAKKEEEPLQGHDLLNKRRLLRVQDSTHQVLRIRTEIFGDRATREMELKRGQLTIARRPA